MTRPALFAGALLLTGLLLAACRTEPPEIVRVDAAPDERARQTRLPIVIEGMTDTLPARLVWAPEGMHPRFSTYVPEDMATSFERTPEGGHTLTVRAMFGGGVQEHAFVVVHFYPPGTPLREAQAQLAAFLASLEPYDDPLLRRDDYGGIGTGPDAPALARQQRFGWAEPELRFRVHRGEIGHTVTGWAALGEHASRPFHVFVHYPEEYGDGMGPRVNLILEEWQWLDNGGRLDEGSGTPGGSP
jgi:hypothetical protein